MGFICQTHKPEQINYINIVLSLFQVTNNWCMYLRGPMQCPSDFFYYRNVHFRPISRARKQCLTAKCHTLIFTFVTFPSIGEVCQILAWWHRSLRRYQSDLNWNRTIGRIYYTYFYSPKSKDTLVLLFSSTNLFPSISISFHVSLRYMKVNMKSSLYIIHFNI